MSRTDRSALQAQYKDREIIGGVYAIRNTLTNRLLVDTTADLRGMKSRFAFALRTGSGLHLKLQKDWDAQKGEGFAFEVLEELVKSEGSTPAAFQEELDLLMEMWDEKLSGQDRY